MTSVEITSNSTSLFVPQHNCIKSEDGDLCRHVSIVFPLPSGIIGNNGSVEKNVTPSIEDGGKVLTVKVVWPPLMTHKNFFKNAHKKVNFNDVSCGSITTALLKQVRKVKSLNRLHVEDQIFDEYKLNFPFACDLKVKMCEVFIMKVDNVRSSAMVIIAVEVNKEMCQSTIHGPY
jgi:hypothetical protein